MALPETSRSAILDALETFDREYRGEGRWEEWQSNRNHKYAIEHRGRLYPVKQIVSLATGQDYQSFSGGDVANSYVERYGFEIVALRGSSLHETFEGILETYLETRRNEPYGKTDEEGNKREIWALFEQAESILEESSVLSQRPHVQVEYSVGRGNWARVPWIAFLDDRETATTQDGIYVVYLFRENMSGVYLTYNQGVTRPKNEYGQKVGYAILKNRAERLRRRASGLAEEGFSLDSNIDLATGGGLGRDYEVSTVGYKLYEQGAVPSDDALLEDLDSTLHAYDRYLSNRKKGPRVQIERARLKEATDQIIRPAILQRGDLEEGGQEGYHHRKILPAATPQLTPSELATRPVEAVEEALKADVNLLSRYEKMYATTLLGMLSPAEVGEKVADLLYGPDPIDERVQAFLEWGEKRERDDGATAQLTGTLTSYLLAFSDPQEYAFCKTRRVYKPAVKALLGADEVRSDWPERITHARAFYKEALRLFQEEHDLPFHDLMHVHIAFFLAENEDENAPWGEGVVEMEGEERGAARGEGRKAFKIAPGRSAEYWDECRENGYICVGWGDVGDLRQYENYDALREAFHEAFYPELYDAENKVSEKSAELWKLSELEPGDLVVANRGINEVLAVGEVVEPGYEYRSGREDFPHIVHVDWDESYAQEIPPQGRWRVVTIKEISDELFQHILERRGSGVDGQVQRQFYQPPPFEQIYDSVQEQGMVIDRRTLRRYHVALSTQGFVILSGVSGTGKTWLTKLYADAVKAKRWLEPVAPNWTTNEDLLGYYNPVDGAYHHTPVSRFLMKAEAAYEDAQARGAEPAPYHLVLDEMNLARVEYYFAKFLSRMEEKKREGTATLRLGPELEVLLPPNLAFIGTVNIDETTHAFADKVYDRAQLIEMRAPRGRLEEHVGAAPHAEAIMDVYDAIGDVAPFAFRVLDEMGEYVDAAQDHGSSWEEALDEQLLQKVLPKVKGTEPKVGEALRGFLEVVPEDTFPLSRAKAQRMLEDFESHGFTSYF